MKKLFISGILAGVLLFQTGCASFLAHRNWVEAQERKAMRVSTDGETVFVGVDLTAMGYLRDNWPMALGAAVVDGVLFYGTHKLYDSNFRSSSGGSSNNSRDETNINVEILLL